MEVTDELVRNTMDLLAAMTSAEIAERTGIPTGRALIDFLSSRTGQMLYDRETGVWCDGPAAIADMYEDEGRQNGAA